MNKNIVDIENNGDSYVTITEGIRGFFCILVCWYPEDCFSGDTDGKGYYDVELSGFMSGETPSEGIVEGRNLAKDYGVQFVYNIDAKDYKIS